METRIGEAKVTDCETAAQADREWLHGCISLLQECTALNDEMDNRLIPSVEHDAYSQAAQEARIRAEGILGKWRALPRPQAPRFVQAHGLLESAIMDLVASFDELCAACDAVDERKAEEHGKKATALLESYGEKFEQAGETIGAVTEGSRPDRRVGGAD